MCNLPDYLKLRLLFILLAFLQLDGISCDDRSMEYERLMQEALNRPEPAYRGTGFHPTVIAIYSVCGTITFLSVVIYIIARVRFGKLPRTRKLKRNSIDVEGSVQHNQHKNEEVSLNDSLSNTGSSVIPSQSGASKAPVKPVASEQLRSSLMSLLEQREYRPTATYSERIMVGTRNFSPVHEVVRGWMSTRGERQDAHPAVHHTENPALSELCQMNAHYSRTVAAPRLQDKNFGKSNIATKSRSEHCIITIDDDDMAARSCKSCDKF